MASASWSKNKSDEVFVTRVDGTAVERPRDETQHIAPISLRSAQHITVTPGRFQSPWSKRLVLIKWVIKGECVLGVGGQRIPFGPGEAAVYLPTLPHSFWATAESNELIWFSIDGPLSEQFMRELGLDSGVYPYGPPPIDQIHELMSSLKDHSFQGRRNSSVLAIRAIYDLANASRRTTAPSTVERVQNIIQQEFADPHISTETIAAKVHYHRGALSRMFHRHTGVTIMEYLTQTRLQEARTLLRHTDQKIADVSRMCGFHQPTYFCRWLRKHCGMGPSEMRQSGGN